MLIVGILSGIGYMRFGSTFQRSRVRAAANLIAGDVQTAQFLAGRERTPIILTLNTSARTYTIATRAGDTTYVRRDLTSAGDYGVDTLRTTATSIQFFPNGFTSGSASLTVATGSYSRIVTVSRAGQVRVTTGS